MSVMLQVSPIARPAWRTAAGLPAGASAIGMPNELTMKVCASSVKGNEPASQVGQTTRPRHPGKSGHVIGRPAARAAGKFRAKPAAKSQFQAEGNHAGGRGSWTFGVGIDQFQIAAKQVEGRFVRFLDPVKQTQHSPQASAAAVIPRPLALSSG